MQSIFSIRITSNKSSYFSYNSTYFFSFYTPFISSIRIVRPAHFPALPLTTEEELKKFEKYLSKDDNAGATICYVSQIIGLKDNVKEAVYKVLKKLISNTLAAQFTLKAGKNVSKKCFETLALYEVVQGAILDKRLETQLPEIDVATSLWLKQAPWRRQGDGSMGKRTKK
ncbi:uncharacterized protein LOC143894207 isoform X2 [Temnothorax americanus]|uniref:uncharacterized protein LOC143894207 isoform X2 n=1 Tax=Temnothorax americanus TaxID=1964332 RepID=UPI0040697DA5